MSSFGSFNVVSSSIGDTMWISSTELRYLHPYVAIVSDGWVVFFPNGTWKQTWRVVGFDDGKWNLVRES